MTEIELLKELRKLADKETYYIIPKSYYDRIFNEVIYLKEELKKAREKRKYWEDKFKEKKNEN